MTVAIEKQFPHLDVEQAKAQVSIALKRAFKAAGGQGKLLKELNERRRARGRRPITQQAISWWAAEGTFVNQEFWADIEQLTDMATTRRHLRPDIYGLAQP